MKHLLPVYAGLLFASATVLPTVALAKDKLTISVYSFAQDAYKKALSIKPHYADAWNNIVFPLQAIKSQISSREDLVSYYPKGTGSHYYETEKLKIDDVLGVWPLHGLNGTWGGIAAGIFGRKSLGAIADISFTAQLVGSLMTVVYALVAGFILYKLIDVFYGLRMNDHDQKIGSDLTFHSIESHPEESL